MTGLTVIHTDGGQARTEAPRWAPVALDNPRYLMATVGTPAGVSLRPVLVGSLHEIRSPAWPGPIWSVPEGTDLVTSAFVFTTSGEIAGVVVREPTGLAIVPWDIALAEATRILDRRLGAASDLRIEVRPLTPALIRATGVRSGVVVAWVDSNSPAAGRVAVGDVIESLNGQPITQTRDWEVASSRLVPGPVALRIRRRGSPIELSLALPVTGASVTPASLGLRMKDVPGVGTAVIGVDLRSAANVARLQEGDVITLAGYVAAPTAAQISSAFRSTEPGEAIMLAITRGNAHLVVGLVK